MSEVTTPESLVERARGIGVEMSADRAAALLRFLDRILEINRELNLTSIRDREDAVVRHILDSLTLVPVWREVTGRDAPRTFLDLGTGGGFPGAALAAAWPQSRGLLIDATGKKVRAVAEALAAAGIANAETLHVRGKDLGRADPTTRGAFDLVAARAVGQTPDILAEVRPLLAPGGIVCAMKGPTPPAEEVAAAERAAQRLRLRRLPPFRPDVPGLDRRTVLVYRADA